jgi:hypothetical protein
MTSHYACLDGGPGPADGEGLPLAPRPLWSILADLVIRPGVVAGAWRGNPPRP